jgi:hypothetical protein
MPAVDRFVTKGGLMPMETGKYIFIIDAEQGYNVLIRIMATLNR